MILLSIDELFSGGGSLLFEYIIPWSFFILAVVSYILRSIFPFNYIWTFFKLIIIFLIAGYAINMAKKSVKSWWEK